MPLERETGSIRPLLPAYGDLVTSHARPLRTAHRRGSVGGVGSLNEASAALVDEARILEP